MKVWKVLCKGETLYVSDEDIAKAYVVENFERLKWKINRYVDGNITTEELRKKTLDFAEFGLPEEVEIEEVKKC